ncbi:TrbG/VirB9 family P-type conjugative transfer protein [Sphingomonas oligoaromativorans]|uniref:TrbG/VirB9 family P-type conjugative transfer protein n=1 Tax=Sphingomonas oligoaromativorans TaxID=575322 RepID=UPI00141F88C9|nr:TrbG/VirB9 family P-type conjugative transfer protein [Sphingomonas oligoaromativorans]NIJ34973.1 type IV secretion system protein VirB9 [Sphingomonas oligoaromativorans]
MTRLALLLSALLLTSTAQAATKARDPRILQAFYDPHQVTVLHGCAGFQSTVAFAPGEHVENIALGNADLWQAVPNKRADLLFLKPVASAGHTNMTVVTDQRRYDFDLIARDDAACHAGHVTYDLQFTYPEEPKPTLAELAAIAPPPPPPVPTHEDAPPPAERNAAYSYTGTAANVPMRVFDDGHSTWMHWADGVAAPAIYSLGPGKQESVVNYTVKGDYLVVDGVAPAYVLRRGPAVATLYDDAYQQPVLDAAAPQPRGPDKAHSALSGLFGSSSPTREARK